MPSDMTERETIEAVAFAMWKEEAAEGTPKSVKEGRTIEAFRDALPSVRERWDRFARAALAALTPHETVEVVPDDPNLWHFWNEKARWLAAKLDEAKRERDDAVKALKDAQEVFERIGTHPESFNDGKSSYAVGWAFYNIQNMAKAAAKGLAALLAANRAA